VYSPAIERALRTAVLAHHGQFRKGDDQCHYAVHPVHVSLMLARLGVEEVVIQAAILHDVVEDCEDWTIERLEDEFGARVAAIVAELTEDKGRGWEERKRHAIEHARHISTEAATVKAADQIHNLESLRAALEAEDDHDAVWARFRGGRERSLAVAEELVAALETRLPDALRDALRASFEGLRRAAAQRS